MFKPTEYVIKQGDDPPCKLVQVMYGMSWRGNTGRAYEAVVAYGTWNECAAIKKQMEDE